MLKTVKTLLRKLDMRILSKLLVIHQTDVDKKNYNGYQWIIKSNYTINSGW